jgi:hypothetical protein
VSTDPASPANSLTTTDGPRAEARPSRWQRWFGFGALLLGALGFAAFVAFTSISLQHSKAFVSGDDPLAWIYLNLPTISGLAGVGAVVLAFAALTGSKRLTKVAVMGFAVEAGLFVALMVSVASAMNPGAPPGIAGEPSPATLSLTLALTPPAIAALAVLIGLVAMLLWFRGISGRRPAFAGLIMGGVPVVYWLFALLILASGGGD